MPALTFRTGFPAASFSEIVEPPTLALNVVPFANPEPGLGGGGGGGGGGRRRPGREVTTHLQRMRVAQEVVGAVHERDRPDLVGVLEGAGLVDAGALEVKVVIGAVDDHVDVVGAWIDVGHGRVVLVSQRDGEAGADGGLQHGVGGGRGRRQEEHEHRRGGGHHC